jgi:hypothetical protein
MVVVFGQVMIDMCREHGMPHLVDAVGSDSNIKCERDVR